jgi:chorismate lyase/3-hydroxybenzoate synthase
VIYALASRAPGTPRENPRQISAYHYPPQYGPRSPAFARATLAPGRERLYISGTASIVGHASQHERDARAQLDETLANLEALIGATDAAEGTAFGGLSSLSHAKVYLRDPSFYLWVRDVLAARLSRDCQTLYLAGEICRGELLLEIEAIASQR